MMSDQKQILVLLAGAPGTGKTYTANKIMQAISGFVSLPLDLFKEHLYDELGFDNLEEKQLLDAEARARYYRGIGMLMQEHKMILGDYPFKTSSRKIGSQTSLCGYHHQIRSRHQGTLRSPAKTRPIRSPSSWSSHESLSSR